MSKSLFIASVSFMIYVRVSAAWGEPALSLTLCASSATVYEGNVFAISLVISKNREERFGYPCAYTCAGSYMGYEVLVYEGEEERYFDFTHDQSGTMLGPRQRDDSFEPPQVLLPWDLPSGRNYARSDLFIFWEPGVYKIRAIQRITEDLTCESNEIEVTVVSAASQNESCGRFTSDELTVFSRQAHLYFYASKGLEGYGRVYTESDLAEKKDNWFSLEGPWQEMKELPDCPWRQALHFAAASEALFDARYLLAVEVAQGREQGGRAREVKGYVEDVVMGFLRDYPDSFLVPLLMHNYDAFYFVCGPCIPRIEAFYIAFRDKEDVSYAALCDYEGQPRRRVQLKDVPRLYQQE